MNIRIDEQTDTSWSYSLHPHTSLTATENKIAVMVKEGSSIKQIAQELKLTTPKTEELIIRIDAKLKRMIKSKAI